MTRGTPRAIAIVAVLGGATAAWANMTPSPTTVTIDCGGATYGNATFSVFYDGASGPGANMLTLVPEGTCTGFGMMPSTFAFTTGTPGATMINAYVLDPTGATCTWDLVFNPITDTPPTVVVQTQNCGGAPGYIDLQPPTVDFATVNEGDIGHRSFMAFNYTGVELDEIHYTITPTADVFEFEDPMCATAFDCQYTFPPGLGVPNGNAAPSPMVRCLGTPSGHHTGTVFVTGNSGAFMGMNTLSCDGGTAATGPQISVPPSIDAGGVDVIGMTNMVGFDIHNAGDANLVVTSTTAVGTASADWTITGCGAGAICTIPPMGDGSVVATFDPSAIGDRQIQIQIQNNDADLGDNPKYVTATGIGRGGLVSTNPANGSTLAFNTQAVGMPSSAINVTLTNTGNQAVDVDATITGPGMAEYAVSPSGTSSVLTSAILGVTCTPAATGPRPAAALELDAPDNLTGTTHWTFPLTCTGINANLQVDPSLIMFDPTQVTSSDSMIVTVTNPTGSPIHVGPVSISGDAAFTLIPAAPEFDLAGSGGMQTFTVVFTPTAEGPTAATTLEGIEPTRHIPVTGTGTVASFTVDPTGYDFAHVCVGEPIAHDFRLVVGGSSEIAVASAALTGATEFAPTYLDPIGYPQTLSPGQTGTVNVHATVEAGEQSAQLTWVTDVAGLETTVVPIHVVGIDEGLAISPGGYQFGMVPVGSESPMQSPQLQSCDAGTVDVTATLVDADGAFRLYGPASATITSVPSSPWAVTFAPPTDGVHHAVLRLAPATGPTFDIQLDGGVDQTPPGGGLTDYYACGCTAPLSPGDAVPMLVVLLVVVVPLRRRRP